MGLPLSEQIRHAAKRRSTFIIAGEYPHPRYQDKYYVVDFDYDTNKIVWTKDPLNALVVGGREFPADVLKALRGITHVRLKLEEI